VAERFSLLRESARIASRSAGVSVFRQRRLATVPPPSHSCSGGSNPKVSGRTSKRLSVTVGGVERGPEVDLPRSTGDPPRAAVTRGVCTYDHTHARGHPWQLGPSTWSEPTDRGCRLSANPHSTKQGLSTSCPFFGFQMPLGAACCLGTGSHYSSLAVRAAPTTGPRARQAGAHRATARRLRTSDSLPPPPIPSAAGLLNAVCAAAPRQAVGGAAGSATARGHAV